MNSNRRYYLHRMVKRFTTVNSRTKQVEITQGLLDLLPSKQRFYLDELLKLGYNLQFVIGEIRNSQITNKTLKPEFLKRTVSRLFKEREEIGNDTREVVIWGVCLDRGSVKYSSDYLVLCSNPDCVSCRRFSNALQEEAARQVKEMTI